MTTFFTADTHMGHRRIIELCDRPYRSIEEMDEMLVVAHNSVVGPDDTVYFLGDIALGHIETSLARFRRMMGRKLLVPGNHDRCFSRFRTNRSGDVKPLRPRDFEMYTDVGFEILPEQTRTTIGAVEVQLSHFPYAGDSHGADRYREARPADDGSWLICGHVHEAWAQRGRQINVGVDVRGFAPISEDALASIIAEGPMNR